VKVTRADSVQIVSRNLTKELFFYFIPHIFEKYVVI